MTFTQQIRSFASRLLGYRAIESTPRRSVVFSAPNLKSEDDILKGRDRLALINLCRELVRNFSVAAWAVRKHVSFVSSFRPAIRGVDQKTRRAIYRQLKSWMSPGNFDISGRFSLHDFICQAELLRTVDGDCLIIGLPDSRYGIVESDRIRNFPEVQEQFREHIENGTIGYSEGVLVDNFMQPRGYSIGKRVNNTIKYELILPAADSQLLAYRIRYDQLRGISPLASTAATLQDLYESIDHEIAKHKISQMFGVKITHDGPSFSQPDTDDSEYKLDLGKAPFLVDLRPGDDISLLETNHPSSASVEFYHFLVSLTIKALDLPYCFFDEANANYSSSRVAWIHYDRNCAQKRRQLQNVLLWMSKRWLTYQLDAGLLPSAATDAEIDWTPAGVPWLDPLKEVQADILALQNGLTSRQEVARRMGMEYVELLEERMDDISLAKDVAGGLDSNDESSIVG